jgi:hypothetical protein
MEGILSNINIEMKATADYAIIAAKEKFGQELDFSEQSIIRLENLLGQVYQTFSNNPNDEETGNVISNTAILWGSYLGDYMVMKWGGTWILKGSDSLVSINNIEFSPISLVYQKITSHPEYSVENYLIETKRIIYTSVINPQQPQYLSENIGQPEKQISIKQFIKSVTIDKHLLVTLAGIGGILLVIVASIIGYRIIKAGGISAFGLIAIATSSNTNVPIEKTLVTATTYSTYTPDPTVTPLPTYTPIPTYTQSPSFTPSLTFTQIATLTPTETKTPFIFKPTLTPKISPTSTQYNPPNTPIPPTRTPSPTATRTPSPTATILPSPTATRTLAPTATRTLAPTATRTPLPTATILPSPTATTQPAPTATIIPSPTATTQPPPTATRTLAPTATNTPPPTATIQPPPTATVTPLPTATNTPQPTATDTPAPTATDTPIPTDTETPIPTDTETPVPTDTETPIPTDTETPIPTDTETPAPTAIEPELVVIESGEIDPFTIPVDYVTFSIIVISLFTYSWLWV